MAELPPGTTPPPPDRAASMQSAGGMSDGPLGKPRSSGLVITLLISSVTMFLMAGEVEQLYRTAGKEPPITTIWGLWFLLPIIGNFIWYFRIQGALNAYWTSNGSIQKARL